MRPADQTSFGVPGGNCFSACVATLLSVPTAEVPYFMGEADWLTPLAEWLRPRGFYPVYLRLQEGAGAWRPQGLYVLGGESVRGPHAVVARGDEVVHDPHPSRAGLLKHEDATLLVPFDPSPLAGCTAT